MKIIFNSLLILLAAAIGLAIGFALRGKPIAYAQEAAGLTPAPQQQALVPLPTSPSVRHDDDSPLATQLGRDLSMSAGVIRWLYWMDALEKAAPPDFPRLIRLARGNYTATRFVAARWVDVNPRHMFDTLVAACKSGWGPDFNELSEVLLDEWPKRDPEAAIAAVNGLENFGMRDSWRGQVAYALVEKDIERGLRLWPAWHLDFGFGPRGMRAVANWTAADPRHAAGFMLEQPAGYYSLSIIETVGKEWAKMDPANALQFAVSQPGNLGSALATGALKEWAERDLNEAAEWLAGTATPTRNRLSPAFVEAWAKQDAAGALNWCESNLTGTVMADAVGGVLKGAAEKDVAAAAALVAGMNPSPARTEAALAVAQKWFPNLASDNSVPPATVAWLADLDADSSKRVMGKIMW